MRCSTYTSIIFIALSLILEINSFPSNGDLVVTPAGTEAPSSTVVADKRVDLKPTIKSMHIESNVSSRYSKTLVTSRVINPSGKANEVSFSIVIPETAFITGFSMEIEGKVYEAYVKEKAEAKKVYQDAVNSGQAAAHVAVKARDSNHFTVSVNLEPESKAIFRLYYEELLQRRLGLYNLIVNLNPGQIVDDLSVDVDISENSPITNLYIPELRTGNEIDALPTDPQNKHATAVISEDRFSAKVHFAPTKEQQIEMMKLFKVKSSEMTTPLPYPIYSYVSNPIKETSPDGISGQFVVQYDVNRNLHGEVLINDGYFVHFFAPENLQPLSKHVIFVLDVSGSMSGRKISQLKEAMMYILQDLNPGDYFNIIDFSYAAKVYNLDDPNNHAIYKTYQSYYYDDQESNKAPPEVPPKPKKATPENIEKAKEIIKNLHASGGTNIYDALTTGLKIANFGIKIQQAVDKSDSPTLRHEPMIIFLTDGDPTVGETSTEKIIKDVTELNTKKTAIFSLAFGEDADRNFLKKISLKNSGFLRHIYEAADADQQLKYFYRQISSPLLANIKYTYPADQVDGETITRSRFDHFFLGSELVIAGKLLESALTVDKPIKVSGEGITGPIDYIPRIPQEKPKKKIFWPLERLWAYVTIKQLLDENDSNPEKADDPKGPAKKALEIALKYSFVTPLTSLVVVKPNSSSAVDAESLQNSPQSASYPSASFALPLSGGSQGRPQFSYSSRLGSPASPGPNGQSGAFGFSGHSLAMSAVSYSRPVMRVGSHGFYKSSLVNRFSQHLPPMTTSSPLHAYPRPIFQAPYIGFPAAAMGPPAPAPPMSQPDYQDSLDSDTVIRGDVGSSQESDTVYTTEATTESIPVSKLTSYSLEKYQWLEQYLSDTEDAVTLPTTTNTTVKYKLKKNSDTYDKQEEKPCGNSIEGGNGVCKYLTDCDELDVGFKDLATYLTFSCDANGFAGICSKPKAP